jgi:1-acyl-sn-glycerol-3-phosphate acyltransferase
LGYSGQPVGFIAKKGTLQKSPSSANGCASSTAFSSIEAIPALPSSPSKKTAEVIKDGYPLIIFPEGTRSKSDEVGPFQAGALKLPIMAKAVIVPFAIKDSYKAFEINNRINAAHIKIQAAAAYFRLPPG